MPKPITDDSTYEVEIQKEGSDRKKGLLLLLGLVVLDVVLNELAGNPLSGFIQFAGEVGFWTALVESIGTFAAFGLAFEAVLGLAIVALAVKKILGKEPGEWFVGTLLFILAVLAALIAELVAILLLTVTGPLLTLIVILLLLGSIVAILTAAVTFLKPVIVAFINWVCGWVIWVEAKLQQFFDWTWKLIIEFKETLERVVERVETWVEQERREWREVRRRTCSSWHWLFSWICIFFTWVVELVLVIVKYLVKVVVFIVKWVIVIILVLIWVIVRVVVWIIIFVIKAIFWCW